METPLIRTIISQVIKQDKRFNDYRNQIKRVEYTSSEVKVHGS